ncbi:hypothetical protein O3G_MSEX007771 [Manduca sexta]|uniref:Uncharacterized protein n=1 Tax=Manduca sexta TaxID=7130 RepID=A0A922CMQ7_MANSE|nr:hypothetical protein O3G_MSEX007771 [Manduca sexta]
MCISSIQINKLKVFVFFFLQEDFLEQVLEEPDVAASKKNKKHRKHKKSKKSAITLDEFLNMNKDVFGEGLDFQGVEEVPTRVITKRLKDIKKTSNAISEISPELEKLRKHGIVIKRKPGQNISRANKRQFNKLLKSTVKSLPNKVHSEARVSTSEDTIDKLLNQTNNQIKIVKKTDKTNFSVNEITPMSNKFHEEHGEMECDSTKKDIGKPLPEDIDPGNISSTVEKNEHKLKDEETVPPETHIATENIEETLNNDIGIEAEDVLQNEAESSKAIPNPNHTKVESTSNNGNNDLETTDINMISKHKRSDDNPNNDVNIEKQSKIDSLSSLKRLSHLITVKSVTPTKNSATAESNLVKDIQPVNVHTAEDNLEPSTISQKDSKSSVNEIDFKKANDLQLNTGKNLQIRSLSPQQVPDQTNIITQIKENSDLVNRSNKTCNINTTKNDNSKPSELIQSKHISTNTGKISIPLQTNYNEMEKQETTNLLKHLTGITAKPINIAKCNNRRNTSLQQRNINKSNVRKILPQKEIINNEEIEIYNIDDSEDEIDQDRPQNNDVISSTIQPTDVLKNLSKNITVRSLSHSIPEKCKVSCQIVQQDKINNDKSCVTASETVSSLNKDAHVTDLSNNKFAKPISEKDIALKNALQNLGKHVTLKSRNISPSQSVHCQNQNEVTWKYERNKDSLKITEVTEEGCDDEYENEHVSDNVIVQSPEDSCSDKDNEDTDMDEDDFENQIKANMLRKDEECIQSPPSVAGVSGMKSPCEDSTKKIPDKVVEKDDSFEGHLNLDITKSLGNQISIKPVKQAKKEVKHENNTNAEQINEQSSHSSQINQKIDVSNQIKNTVNKQVMVKTFQTQTKTVIEEITTTVTKTIKTVNHSLKQEVRNVNNYSSTSALPQKIQGMRVNKESRNLQGIVVRHSSPVMRPKIGISPPTKSAVGTTVRHSSQVIPVGTSVRPGNQVVPIRPRSNIVRPSNPRMPSVQKIRPSTVNQPAVRVGRPLKVFSETMVVPVKRPGLEDLSGPFSCFKKPKESLIPVSDVPILNNSESESMMEYTSVCKSNSMNTAATLKNNSVITSTQIKSEVNTTSQQLSRLNNTSGIKVTKINQSKQAQVQETSEISASQRTTLEAIQKLQKQGLLVKKPRLDLAQDSDGSDHSGNNSTDEND